MKKWDVVDENGKIKQLDDAKIAELFPISEIEKEIIIAAVKNCTDFSSQPQKRVDSMDSKCDGAPLKFFTCMALHFSAACPEEKQSKSSHCVKMRNKFGKKNGDDSTVEVDQLDEDE